jgi:ubiquitin-conjugating enzyme E2 variant
VPFRVHHDDPKDITRHGFVATNGHNCFVSLVVLIPALLLPASLGIATPLIQAFLLALSLGVLATNQFHKWSHQDVSSPLVTRLQAWHIVLGREHHAVHHAFPYHRHYCITTGWLNRPLDAIGFFRKLEWLIERVTGVAPRTDDLGHTPPAEQTSAPKPG